MEEQDLEALLSGYLEGSLTQAGKLKAERLIDTDPKARELLEELSALDDGFRKLKDTVAPAALSAAFYQALEAEKAARKQQVRSGLDRSGLVISGQVRSAQERPRQVFLPRHFWQAAAAAVLLLAAFMAGLTVNRNGNRELLTAFQDEMRETRVLMAKAMLKAPSDSERLMAVQYSYQVPEADTKMAGVLAHCLKNDQNLNVRLAAAEALMRFGGMEAVREAVLVTLANTQEPLLQITLIDVLVQWREPRAIPLLRGLHENPAVIQDVRNSAGKGLGSMM